MLARITNTIWNRASIWALLLLASSCWPYHPLVGIYPVEEDPLHNWELLALLQAGVVQQTSPASFSNLVLWLEADQLNFSQGQAVDSWPDLSGNAFHAEQSIVAQRPTFATAVVAFNGLSGVLFDKSSDPGNNLILGSNYLYSTGDGFTVLAVAHSNEEDTTTSYLMDFGKNGAGGTGFMYSSNSDGAGNNFTMYTPVDAGGVFTVGAVQVQTSAASILSGVHKFAPAADAHQTIYLNGSQINSTAGLTLTQLTGDEICRSDLRGAGTGVSVQPPASTGTCSGGSFSYGPVTIDGQSKRSAETGRFFDGEIALFVWYNRALSESERQQLECYAALKYAIAVNHDC